MRLAARGQRESDGGTEPVGDAWLADQLRRQARDVHVESLSGAAVLTGLALLIPG